ncbi:MAG: hypothetical protein OEN02_11750, partial [Gammaproteobacteria bacterium]|nr:hypothetical protein [Gammaproteobacteria bacterium]
RLIPRSFRLPYRRETHRQVEDTLQQQRQGERFVGSPVAGGAGERIRLEFDVVERDTSSHKSSLPQ